MITDAIAQAEQRKFASSLSMRRIGVELEYPAVDQENWRGFDLVDRLFPVLTESSTSWIPSYDTETGIIDGVLVGNKNLPAHERVFVTRDAARSMLEVVFPPAHSLHEIRKRIEDIFPTVQRTCYDEGGYILGYAMQPYDDRGIWFPGKRYRLLQEALGKKTINYVTRGTASQVHIEVTQNEVIPFTNVSNALSGVKIILFANSPIELGEFSGLLARRQSFYGSFAPDRAGMPPIAFRDFGHYLDFVINKTFLIGWRPHTVAIPQRRGSHIVFGDSVSGNLITFREYLESIRLDEIPGALERQLPLHEATIWFNARPRTHYGTVEIREACTQPFTDTLVVPAFNLGIAENLDAAQALVERAGWGDWMQLHNDAIRLGFHTYFFDAPVGAPGGIVETALNIAEEGLRRRGLGEERYLAPLWQRLARRKNPADKALSAFRRGPDAFRAHLKPPMW